MEASAHRSQRRILRRILWAVGGAALLTGLLFALAFADALGFFHDPPLRLERSGSTLTAHVETLGEYETTVGRIRIQESDSDKVVFEAVAARRAPQIFNFVLAAGANRTNLMGDEGSAYSVVEPSKETTFMLHPGVRYRITVWGDSWTFRRADFVL
jgi:hypothetical protein